MENPSDSGTSHVIKITHLGKKVKRQTHSPEQNFNKHNKKRDILQEAQNHHMLKYVQGKDISDITPHGQSYQNSPVHFNILAELGTSTTPIKQMPGLFEDSLSFGVHFDNDVVESTNLNSKIAQILTDSKSELDIKDPHAGQILEAGKVDLSFSVRTDYSVDMNDNTETHRLKKSRREKVPSKVTIDESLNTDLMYDPETSATAQGKSDKKKKPEPKKEVVNINVYARGSPKRVEPVKENGNMTPEGKLTRKISANLECKPTKTEEDENQVEKLYHGVTTPDRKALERESRWSKLEEDQAAKLFHERKTNLFEGLKKLNKTKTVAVSTKSNQPSPKRSARQGDGSGKKDAVKLDSWSEGNSMQSKIVDLRTGKVVKKRASTNQRSKRTSVTPKKESSSNRYNPPKSLSVDLKLRSRSLSNDDPKPIEQFLKNYSSNRPPAEKTQMIDEIYKQAKEDVQKRIANIERKLLENESYDLQKSKSTGNSATIKSVPQILSVSSPQSNNQTPTLFATNQRKISSEANLESGKKANSRPRSPENMDAYRPSQEQRSPEKVMVVTPNKGTRTPSSNKATPVKVTFVSPQGAQQRNISFNVAPPAEVEKVAIKKVNRVERGNSKEPVANNGNKRPQQAIQAPNSPDAYFSLRQATGGNESKRGNTPTKMANSTPSKFSDIEQTSIQRNSYSKIHADRAVRAFASPQAKDNQIPLEDSVANFLMLEKTLKAQIAKEAASGSKRKPPSHGSPVRPQNVRPASKEPKEQDNNRTNARREDSQLKDRKNMNAEVKQFTLRPQSVEKTPVKKGNPASQSDGFKRAAGGSTPDKSSQLRKASKEPKPHANTATNFFSADQWQDANKIPRSSSDQKIKAIAFTKSPKAVLNRVLQTDHNRPQVIDNSNETSLMSTKSLSTIGRQPIMPNKSDVVRREKPVRALASPEIHKNSKTTISEADESMSSKNDYLKSLFNKQKATPAVEKRSPPQVNKVEPKQRQKTPQKQKVEENLVYATSSDDLEELLKQNYKFLEIRNNQYVFTNSN